MTPMTLTVVTGSMLFLLGSVGFLIHRNRFAMILMIGMMFQAGTICMAGFTAGTSPLVGQMLIILELLVTVSVIALFMVVLLISKDRLLKSEAKQTNSWTKEL
jgi:NADH:ubiquinone oxidoreductase subunit K